MHRIARTAVRLAIAAPITLVAACGGDERTHSTGHPVVATHAAPGTRLSLATWITTVNDLCVAHNEALAQVVGPLFADGLPGEAAAEAAADEIVRRTRTVAHEIDELNEPSSIADDVAAPLPALDAGSDDIEALGGPAFFASNDDPYRPAARIAGELGLDACDNEA